MDRLHILNIMHENRLSINPFNGHVYFGSKLREIIIHGWNITLYINDNIVSMSFSRDYFTSGAFGHKTIGKFDIDAIAFECEDLPYSRVYHG